MYDHPSIHHIRSPGASLMLNDTTPDSGLNSEELASAITITAMVANGASIHAAIALAEKNTGPVSTDALARVRDAAVRIINHIASSGD